MATEFQSYLSASSFNQFTIRDFAASATQYNSDQKELTLNFPQQGLVLPKSKNKLYKITTKRRSQRSFTEAKLTQKELGLLLQSFYAKDGLEHRTYPSAGASYATEIFVVLLHTDHEYNGNICYYNAKAHSLIALQKAPEWQELKNKVNVTVKGTPQVIICFASLYHRATEKYGERGGRFALVEAGAAMQQLALTVAASKQLKGVVSGGMYDDYWLSLCGLQPAEAFVALGYLCGK